MASSSAVRRRRRQRWGQLHAAADGGGRESVVVVGSRAGARDRSGGAGRARVVGTVQIQPSWAPNQPHRGDVAKLIVHRRARRRGIGRALMETLERTARAAGYTLLLLDTRKGDYPERTLFVDGWVRVGEVPDFAFNPDGTMCTTVFYYKRLASG